MHIFDINPVANAAKIWEEIEDQTWKRIGVERAVNDHAVSASSSSQTEKNVEPFRPPPTLLQSPGNPDKRQVSICNLDQARQSVPMPQPIVSLNDAQERIQRLNVENERILRAARARITNQPVSVDRRRPLSLQIPSKDQSRQNSKQTLPVEFPTNHESVINSASRQGRKISLKDVLNDVEDDMTVRETTPLLQQPLDASSAINDEEAMMKRRRAAFAALRSRERKNQALRSYRSMSSLDVACSSEQSETGNTVPITAPAEHGDPSDKNERDLSLDTPSRPLQLGQGQREPPRRVDQHSVEEAIENALLDMHSMVSSSFLSMATTINSIMPRLYESQSRSKYNELRSILDAFLSRHECIQYERGMRSELESRPSNPYDSRRPDLSRPARSLELISGSISKITGEIENLKRGDFTLSPRLAHNAPFDVKVSPVSGSTLSTIPSAYLRLDSKLGP